MSKVATLGYLKIASMSQLKIIPNSGIFAKLSLTKPVRDDNDSDGWTDVTSNEDCYLVREGFEAMLL